ncbi:MAG: uracil-DNA glycosylase [Hyphomonadaceae bacterium JAD_PAG50586_4]|nr:MAG: uracil-DNA glycosylase [Hyphomonadaceae bacterium JAD_PAG50586_4]
MTPTKFVEAIASVAFENAFNPYADRCAVHDQRDAPRQRSAMLRSMLEAALLSEVDAIWIGRDLGYRGGRRTGLALTDDVHIERHAARWGLPATRPTKGQAVAERTAAVIWSVLECIAQPIFLWNVFPLHPHEEGDPFTNRAHNAKERRAGEEILDQLVVLIQPRRLIAIGNNAVDTACRIAGGLEVAKIRHPSYGGQTQFVSQARDLYGVADIGAQQLLI